MDNLEDQKLEEVNNILEYSQGVTNVEVTSRNFNGKKI